MVPQSPNFGMFFRFDKKLGGFKGLGTTLAFFNNEENKMIWF